MPEEKPITKVERVCERCGNRFLARLTEVKRGYARFCSRQCFNGPRTDYIAGFWKRVDKNGPVPSHCAELGPCWIWKGAHFFNGYGEWHQGAHRVVKAHRLSWRLHYGPVPHGLDVLHRCDVKNCVNPRHLFIGNDFDNMRDAASKGRLKRGEQLWTAKLTADQVREIRSLGEQGTPRAALALQFGVTRTNITFILNRQSWKHI